MNTQSADPIVNGFSVDVEDWYQVSDFDSVINFADWDHHEHRLMCGTERILSLLDAVDVKGTFFVLAWNAERWPEIVQRIASAGHEIACHGYAHRLVYQQTPDEFRSDVVRAKAILEEITGRPVLGYRAPSYSVMPRSQWALDILLECGFQYDSSVFPIRDSLYGWPDAPRFPHVIQQRHDQQLVEFPMTTMRLGGRNWPLGGGGYLRILPYHYMYWGMRRVNRSEGQPTVVYVHPWELDPEQPRMQTAGKRGFSTHYVGLQGTAAKLKRLLDDFQFAPLRDVLHLS